MTYRYCLCLVALIFISPILSAQGLKGTIVEKGTTSPMVGAHIYIINSLQGTVSNADGRFTLNPPNSYGEILVTYVGYEDKKIEFTPASKNIIIGLTPLANQLEEVAVNSSEDKKWKRLYKKFESTFLGSTENASHCVITNPWVVDVAKGADGEIVAHSREPIDIINNALGYKLTFYLTAFTLKADRLHYQGFVYFDELTSRSATTKSLWGQNRKETYLGSKSHFVSALNNENLKVEGFEIYEATFSAGIGFTTKKKKKEFDLLKTSHELSIADYLKIVYKKAPPQRAYLSNQTQQSYAFQGPKADLVPKGNLQMSQQSLSSQVSYLYSRNSKLVFLDNGYIKNNKYIIEYGYWSWLGVAEMLPYEYVYK
jgi:carboxypeptidase-like protein